LDLGVQYDGVQGEIVNKLLEVVGKISYPYLHCSQSSNDGELLHGIE
jgi:hypothetical protein